MLMRFGPSFGVHVVYVWVECRKRVMLIDAKNKRESVHQTTMTCMRRCEHDEDVQSRTESDMCMTILILYKKY